VATAATAGVLAVAGCTSQSGSSASGSPAKPVTPSAPSVATQPAGPVTGRASIRPLPGMPPPLDPRDLYAANRPGQFAAVVRGMRPLVWVPNSDADTVSVIDPSSYRVVRTFRVDGQPHHVVPSWDLKTLWVNNTKGNTLTPIDPVTGRVGQVVRVRDPYNLYFTPDGRHAVVMAHRDREIVFRDPHTMAVRKAVPAGCAGVNHADFSADGRYFIVSCEFSGELLKVDVAAQRVIGKIPVPAGGMPQDVKISPDGRTWYVADMRRDGVWVVDGDRFRVVRLLRTGRGAHGLYVSRDSRHLYISNRDEGSVSRLDFASGRLTKWRIPGGGSPDMGGVSADGRVLWLAGRYHGEVYAMDTRTGRLIRRIRVGAGPHGLCVYPQPGRYSLGHTGILR
jgi:YVTN family beta-propeller protein